MQDTLSEFIRSQQTSSSGSHPPPSSRPQQHRCSTSCAPPPLPQLECQYDGDGDDNGSDSGGENLGYDQHSNYNYFNNWNFEHCVILCCIVIGRYYNGL